MKKKIGWFMNILDKIEISKTRFCPPHYIPHKLPIGKRYVMKNATFIQPSGEWCIIFFIANT